MSPNRNTVIRRVNHVGVFQFPHSFELIENAPDLTVQPGDIIDDEEDTIESPEEFPDDPESEPGL